MIVFKRTQGSNEMVQEICYGRYSFMGSNGFIIKNGTTQLNALKADIICRMPGDSKTAVFITENIEFVLEVIVNVGTINYHQYEVIRFATEAELKNYIKESYQKVLEGVDLNKLNCTNGFEVVNVPDLTVKPQTISYSECDTIETRNFYRGINCFQEERKMPNLGVDVTFAVSEQPSKEEQLLTQYRRRNSYPSRLAIIKEV